MVAEHVSVITEADYREREERSTEKHEFVNGRIYAMEGASPAHNRLAAAALISLGSQLNGKPCEPFGSDQRVKAAATGINTYPDVVVACPPLSFDSDNRTLLDAVVIIEVLSPSTAEYDRTDKFAHYAQLPSLQHYVLVSQERVLVEHRWRSEEAWRFEICTSRDDEIHLGAIDCRLTLSELYARLDVPSGLAAAPHE